PFDIPPPPALGGAVNFSDPSLANATDAQIPTGAYIGRINTVAKLGIANEGCVTDSPVDFDLIDASTPATTNVLIAGGSGNSAAGNLAEDEGPLDPQPLRSRGSAVVQRHLVLLQPLFDIHYLRCQSRQRLHGGHAASRMHLVLLRILDAQGIGRWLPRQHRPERVRLQPRHQP